MWSLVHSVRTAETVLTPGVLLGHRSNKQTVSKCIRLIRVDTIKLQKNILVASNQPGTCCFLHAGFEVHYLTTNYCFSFSSGRRVPQ